MERNFIKGNLGYILTLNRLICTGFLYFGIRDFCFGCVSRMSNNTDYFFKTLANTCMRERCYRYSVCDRCADLRGIR